MRISDWSSDVCSSDLIGFALLDPVGPAELNAPVADRLFEAGRRRERTNAAFVYLRSDIVDEIVGNLHRLPRADRIYIKRVRCGNARGAERGHVADPAIISLRGENARAKGQAVGDIERSEEHTSELQSLMRISYAVFCLKKKN